MNPLHSYSEQQRQALVSPRPGESKIGEQLQLPCGDDWRQALTKARQQGARYAILGIPEDIGPRANLGRGGADGGWQAFLGRFCNLQHNRFIRSHEILLLGEVATADLQEQAIGLDASNSADLARLRELVAQLDARVSEVIAAIRRADLLPIVIGGGHNNALPIIQGCHQAHEQPMACINLDPHTDFRALEGRHSGNGFRYAADQGALSHYFALGMHELKNSQANLEALAAHHFPAVSYQEIWTRREISLAEALQDASCYLLDSGLPIGIELDVDSIAFMPASAYTNCGVSIQDAEFYVHQIAGLPRTCYLHLAEGAPCQHPGGLQAGVSDVGQALAALVTAFIQAHQATD